MKPTIEQNRQVHYPLNWVMDAVHDLQINDPDWKYEIVKTANGRARIDVYDEEGELIQKGMAID